MIGDATAARDVGLADSKAWRSPPTHTISEHPWALKLNVRVPVTYGHLDAKLWADPLRTPRKKIALLPSLRGGLSSDCLG